MRGVYTQSVHRWPTRRARTWQHERLDLVRRYFKQLTEVWQTRLSQPCCSCVDGPSPDPRSCVESPSY